MANGLLGLIARPAQADVVGQFRAGQQTAQQNQLFQQQQAEQQRGIAGRQLAGDILAQQVGGQFGGKLGELAKIDPGLLTKIAGPLGIPLNDQAAAEQRVTSISSALSEFAKFAGAGQIDLAINSIANSNLPPELIEQSLASFEEDPEGTLQNLFKMNELFNPTAGPSDLDVAKAEKIRAETGAITGPKVADQKQINVLRKSINDLTKDFRSVDQAISRVKAVGSKGTGAGDLALIFNFMKLLDPGSVVRESEFRTAEDARAFLAKAGDTGITLPGFVVQGLEKAATGAKLLPEQRQDFLSRADELFSAARSTADDQIANVLQQADQDQIKRQRVFGKKRLADFNERVASRATPSQVFRFDAQGNPI